MFHNSVNIDHRELKLGAMENSYNSLQLLIVKAPCHMTRSASTGQNMMRHPKILENVKKT